MLHIYRSLSSRLQMEKKKTSNEMKSELLPGDHGDQAAATESILCLGNVYVFLNHARMMNLS